MATCSLAGFLSFQPPMMVISKRLLIYHSPFATRVLGKRFTLVLPDNELVAFAPICRWMCENKLGILTHCIRTGGPTGIQDACNLVCRIFAAAYSLKIDAIQPLIFEGLREALAMAREAGQSTPVVPSMVMEVWEDGGEDCMLCKFVLEEMCVAYSRGPFPVTAEYDECFEKIDPFNRRLQRRCAISDKI